MFDLRMPAARLFLYLTPAERVVSGAIAGAGLRWLRAEGRGTQ